ncbi:respiratory nitrate reductase subunit gamma [Hyalangium versicolor]|uniref:respiratory nitrate reductase subunit gamma n=1 Tax=Hyalangium versicolor TaxID=2861190 RepID=UPI001CCDBA05|nr:respiratory nitrate reductase subunit gamma [Hyalangium versicolor]
MSDIVLYGYLPYAALLACGVGVVRRLQQPRPSARASEPRPLSVGGLILIAGAGIVALNHLAGLLLREPMRAFLASPARLFTFEAVSLIGGLLLAWGLVQVIAQKVREASWSLRGLYALLLLQVVGGLAMAVGTRWGALWSLDITVPYLCSLLTLHPDVTLVAQAPLGVRVHVLLGFVLIALAPFIQARRAAERVAVPSVPDASVLVSRRQETAPRAEP